MKQVAESVTSVSDIVAQLAAAGTEQGNGIQRVNRAVGQTDHATQQNAALAEQATASTDTLAADVDMLLTTVKAFRRGA